MNRVREKLTYANVVSSLCLLLLVGGGTAFATNQLPKESVGTKELKNNAVTPAKLSKAAKRGMVGPAGAPGAVGPQGAAGPPGAPGAPATALWAVIGVEGETLSASPAVVRAGKVTPGNGQYEVVFNRDVSKCAFVSTSHAGTGVSVAAEPRTGNANAVFVATTVDDAQGLDNAFSLGVFC